MAIRTEQTLRDMWDAHLNRRSEAEKNGAEAVQCAQSADAHDRAVAQAKATADAEAQAAQADRRSAQALFNLAEGRAAEAADLADLVNRERAEAGLAPLTPGEPYPADPQDPTVTRTDGEVADR